MNNLPEVADMKNVEQVLRGIEDYAERVQPDRHLGIWRMWETHRSGIIVAYRNSKPGKPTYIVIKDLPSGIEMHLEGQASIFLPEGSYQFYNTAAPRCGYPGRGLRIRVR